MLSLVTLVSTHSPNTTIYLSMENVFGEHVFALGWTADMSRGVIHTLVVITGMVCTTTTAL